MRKSATLIQEEHVKTANDFLAKSDGYFAEGDVLKGSEKLWSAAAHAVMALAQERGWQFGNHYALRQVALRLADEMDDERISLGFGVSEKFHANFYHDFMEDNELDANRPSARRFVERMLALIDEMPEQSTNGIAE